MLHTVKTVLQPKKMPARNKNVQADSEESRFKNNYSPLKPLYYTQIIMLSLIILFNSLYFAFFVLFIVFLLKNYSLHLINLPHALS